MGGRVKQATDAMLRCEPAALGSGTSPRQYSQPQHDPWAHLLRAAHNCTFCIR
jgi:hypothetical protein